MNRRRTFEDLRSCRLLASWHTITSIAALLALLLAGSGNAFVFDANIVAEESDVANGISVDVNGDAVADLQIGDVIRIEVVVENPDHYEVFSILARIEPRAHHFELLGGTYFDILTDDSCMGEGCVPSRLSPTAGAPSASSFSPPGVLWIDVVSHAANFGAGGPGPGAPLPSAPGPDVSAIVDLEVVSEIGTSAINVPLRFLGAAGSGFNLPPQLLHGVSINVPEPGSMAATLAGLGAAVCAARRRQSHLRGR